MDAFEALSDPTRRRLLLSLAAGPLTAGALAATEPVSRPAVSRHLRGLREAGLVTAAARGRERVYAIDEGGLEPLRALLQELAAPLDPAPPIRAEQLDALELEVRRTVREHDSRLRRQETA